MRAKLSKFWTQHTDSWVSVRFLPNNFPADHGRTIFLHSSENQALAFELDKDESGVSRQNLRQWRFPAGAQFPIAPRRFHNARNTRRPIRSGNFFVPSGRVSSVETWTLDGPPTEGTEEIIEALESVLRRDPNHLGANLTTASRRNGSIQSASR